MCGTSQRLPPAHFSGGFDGREAELESRCSNARVTTRFAMPRTMPVAGVNEGLMLPLDPCAAIARIPAFKL
jgi:hypothetical protein